MDLVVLRELLIAALAELQLAVRTMPSVSHLGVSGFPIPLQADATRVTTTYATHLACTLVDSPKKSAVLYEPRTSSVVFLIPNRRPISLGRCTASRARVIAT